MKKGWVISLVIMSSLVLAACGNNAKTATETSQGAKDGNTEYPVTISNFSRTEASATWQGLEQTFAKAPEKVLANTQPAAELMLHLGLKKHIAGVGAVFGTPDKTVASDFADLNHLGKDYISQEVALSVEPDLVYGRSGLFDAAEWGVGTVPSLNGMGIPTYVLESSVPGGTFASIYTDIANLGKIFNVPEAAAAFSEELKARQSTLETKLASIKDERTFALLFNTDAQEVNVYPAQDETFFNDILTMVKLNNIFKTAPGEVSVEQLIAADPEVLIIPNWETTGGVSAADIKAALYANPKLTSMQAIKKKQIYAIDYNYMFGYGYLALDGMELLAAEMHPDLFK